MRSVHAYVPRVSVTTYPKQDRGLDMALDSNVSGFCDISRYLPFRVKRGFVYLLYSCFIVLDTVDQRSRILTTTLERDLDIAPHEQTLRIRIFAWFPP